MRIVRLLLCGALLAFALAPTTAQAHTSLASASPGDGDTLSASPPMLELTFSGVLERGNPLHAIEIAGPSGEAVELPPPTLSDDRKTIGVALPELAGGRYAVTYRVVSGDGHPIEGGYAFTVNGPAPPSGEADPDAGAEAVEGQAGAGDTEEAAASEPGTGNGQDVAAPEERQEPPADEHAGHAGHEAGGAASGSGAGLAAPLYASRILYYATMLPLLGWALWSAFRRQSADALAEWRRVGLRLQGAHAVAFVVHVALQWAELSHGLTSASFLDLLRSTALGQSWLFTGLLTLAGFPLLFRYRAVDAVWALLLIGAKTLRGHASSFEPVVWARLADGVHLGAAAIWIGGLLALAWFAPRAPDRLRAFAPTFSNAALAAFAVLAATGAVSAMLYTESLADIVRTTWGRLLLAKVALAAAVLPVAAMLRRRLRAEAAAPGAFRRWLRVDAARLAGIVALTGVLTHMSPVVERVPFRWHVMGETAHLTAEIPDLRAGGNELSLKIWVPTEDGGAPKVSVAVVEPGGAETSVDLAVVDIPAEAWESFIGFDKYTFSGTVVIADPEEASLRVVIERANGDALTYENRLGPDAAKSNEGVPGNVGT